MSDINGNRKDIDHRMARAVEVLQEEFGGLRTGRASTSLLDPVMVNAYGSPMPLNQVGSVSVPEPRMLSIQVWDKSNVKAVEKAIIDSGLGLNPAVDGTLVRIPIPPLTEERRQELVKVAGKYAEEAKIAVRNVRRSAIDDLKKDEAITQDAMHGYTDEIQELTDKYVEAIDEAFTRKEQEIMQV
jgi:ribosome recycling factor